MPTFKTIDYSEPVKAGQSPEDQTSTKENSEAILRVVLTGGGSGGHVMPLLAVTEALRVVTTEKKIDLRVRYLGPEDDYSEILKAAEVEISPLASAKWRRYASVKNILDIPVFFIGFAQALIKLLVFMPDAIFSKGGTGALPVVLAGWLYRIPIIIHESDSVPGLTNAISGRFAKRIALSFDRAKNYFPPKKTAVVGTPILPALLQNVLSQKAAKEVLGFEINEPVVLIIGGSQGAQPINEFVVTNLEDITAVAQVIHQTGTANFAEIQKLSRVAILEISPKTGLPKRYRLLAYLKTEDMKNALAAADVVISRAGSGALFDIAAFKKPAILVPLPGSARDHQRLNAYEFAKCGGAIVVEQTNLMPGIFIEQIKEVLADEARKEEMSKGSASFFIPNAAEVLAQEILKISNKS